MKQAETIEVTRTYLEMNQPDEFKPRKILDDSIRVVEVRNCPPDFYRYLYRSVGEKYHWVDRINWTDEQIRVHLSNSNLSLWVLYYKTFPAGYYELHKHPDGATEIAYLGLLPDYVGRGLGGHLLTVAVERAWQDGAQRVWLHTCSLDAPAALPNYIKRGFRPFRQESYSVTITPAQVSKKSA